MSSHRSGRKGAAIAALCALALAASACGGDDEEPTTTDAGTTGAAGVTGSTGVALTADDLVTCLNDAGLDASIDEPVLGLESEHEAVSVAIGDLDEGAALVVFGGEEQAEAEAEAVDALAGVANTEVAGNVIWGLDAAADETPVLVFDEVDAGIGGRHATGLGERLRSLARFHQVLCVTHLPQVAAYADHHVHVGKRVVDGRTVAEARSLDGEERSAELAAMLAGEGAGSEAQAAAEALLRSAAG